jgi:hypothetical protein
MDMNAARALDEIMESLEDQESKQWLKQLLDLKARACLPDHVDLGLDVWRVGEQSKDDLRLLFRSVRSLVEPREPSVTVPLVPPAAPVVLPPSPPAEEEDEDEDDASTVALMTLLNVLGLVVLVVGLCFLLHASTSDIEKLAARVRMAENTARRASLGAAVCLRLLQRNQTITRTSEQDTLLTRAALLALSPAVSKAWAYVPMRRVAHCNCTSRLEFARFKNATDARLEALEQKAREQAERTLALETQAKEQKIRVDALADSFSTAALIWSMSAIGLAALVVTGTAPMAFAGQALAATTAGVGMALVEQNMV